MQLQYSIAPSICCTCINQVDTRDVAGAAVALLLPKEKLDEFLAVGRIQVHGLELLSFGDQAAALSNATGKKIVVNSIPPDDWIAAMV